MFTLVQIEKWRRPAASSGNFVLLDVVVNGEQFLSSAVGSGKHVL